MKSSGMTGKAQSPVGAIPAEIHGPAAGQRIQIGAMRVMTSCTRELPLLVERKVRRNLQGGDHVDRMILVRKPMASRADLGHRLSQPTVLLYGNRDMAASAIQPMPSKIVRFEPLLLSRQARKCERKKERKKKHYDDRLSWSFNSKTHPAPPSTVPRLS
jgi:hypothetical protein